MAGDFLGIGWAWPVRTDPTGNIAMASGVADIEESIRIILGTAYGERPLRPDFGCGIHDLVFAPVDATFAGRVAFEVRASLTRWEPRIEVRAVDALIDVDDAAAVHVHIAFVVRQTNDPRNLVFPFYALPPE